MELKEFIKRTLAEIVEATAEASEELKDSVNIYPRAIQEYNGYPSVSVGSQYGLVENPLMVVGFKVLVEVCQTKTQEGRAGVRALQVLEARYKGTSSKDRTETHEVSFSVPLTWKADR
jgi:hypothetical protein